jgi:copper(I)-binding protein
MRFNRPSKFFLSVLMLLTEITTFAEPLLQSEHSVVIKDGWVRAVPTVARATAVYFEIHNASDSDDFLMRATTSVARVAELHEAFKQDQGKLAMRQVSGLFVKAGDSLIFEPGGRHVMLVDLLMVLAEGDTVRLELHFKNAGTQVVNLPVRSLPPQAIH